MAWLWIVIGRVRQLASAIGDQTYNNRDGRLRTYFVGITVANPSIPPMPEL
jgi:hypothetical protein